eukprot:TRINITY_DN2078_c0_g1_i1.p1 TRINITY_DN2078_c0_g1~~TRINITY_DN2078_c0_g1_i1.p1  ORF type:complete len:110 (-),score=29.63 TRINITY_DN2078_c0_g1_i1:151-480(-)
MSGKGGKGGNGENQQQNNKTKELIEEVDKVKDIMHNNIQNLSKNMDSVEMLESKTSAMRDASKTFANNSRTLKNQMWWKNMKLMLFIGLIVALILAVVITVIVLRLKKD